MRRFLDASESTTRSCGIELALTLQAYRHLPGGEHIGRNPTDRGNLGSKHHLLVDERGLPLVAEISGTQVHNSRFLIPLVKSIPAVKGLVGRARKRLGKLHADRAYASRAHRARLRSKGIAARIARYGVESRERLGRWRWVVEQTSIRHSCRLPARSSVGGTSRSFVRRSNSLLEDLEKFDLIIAARSTTKKCALPRCKSSRNHAVSLWFVRGRRGLAGQIFRDRSQLARMIQCFLSQLGYNLYYL